MAGQTGPVPTALSMVAYHPVHPCHFSHQFLIWDTFFHNHIKLAITISHIVACINNVHLFTQTGEKPFTYIALLSERMSAKATTLQETFLQCSSLHKHAGRFHIWCEWVNGDILRPIVWMILELTMTHYVPWIFTSTSFWFGPPFLPSLPFPESPLSYALLCFQCHTSYVHSDLLTMALAQSD